MFSAEDAKEIYQLLSSKDESDSPLILAAYGDGFVARTYTRRAFEDLITTVYATQRVKLSSLARDLDVNVETVRTLAEEHEGTLLLRSVNGREIIAKSQRDAIRADLEYSVTHGVLSKEIVTRKYDLSQGSLDLLINTSELQVVEVDGYLYGISYGKAASDAIAALLMSHLENLQSIDLDSTNVLGSPPAWFIHRTVNALLKTTEFAEKIYVQDQPNGVRCTPIQLVKQAHDIVISNLQSGERSLLDLQVFQRDNNAIYPTLLEAQTRMENTQGVDIVGTFAISEAWISNSSKVCLLDMTKYGGVEIRHSLGTEFPDVLLGSVIDKVAHDICTLSQGAHRIDDCIWSESGYSQAHSFLIDLARDDAANQWQQMKLDPKTDFKYSLSNIVQRIQEVTPGFPPVQILTKEKTVERALEESFSAKLLELEQQNEAEFAKFWTDRVSTRTALYTEGLTLVEDQKLQGQLAELLAQYVQKELVPDAVSKATSQGLVLSRKTRKNLQRLEVAVGADGMDVSTLVKSLDKFIKKQSIEAPASPDLDASKGSMLGDMARRMQKQKKSDGPLLFLTLIVFLFAKHNAGVIYATGKFAPKLLKQLKNVIEPEEYAQLEGWKEAAKAGTLSADDRDAMKRMVEARV